MPSHGAVGPSGRALLGPAAERTSLFSFPPGGGGARS